MTTIHWPESTQFKRPVKRGKNKNKHKTPEHALQIQIAKVLRKHSKALWYSVPNGGYRHLFTATKLRAEGARRGTPDLCFVLEGGRAAFLELKADKGRLSEDQITFRNHAWNLGAEWAVAYSFKEAVDYLADWRVLPFRLGVSDVIAA